MAQNDPAVDNINYSGAMGLNQIEFDIMKFEDIEESDLFWFSDNPNSNQNHVFRKVNENTAQDTRNGYIAKNIDKFMTVYQKT